MKPFPGTVEELSIDTTFDPVIFRETVPLMAGYFKVGWGVFVMQRMLPQEWCHREP